MSSPGPTMAIHCTVCGVPVAAGSRFCGACGATVAAPDTPVPGAAAFDEAWNPIVDRLRSATAGEFRIIRQIGRGGMAAVFLAHEEALNRRVAIKVMSPALLLADGMLDRFRNEAIAVAKMTHPNIVTVHAVRHVGDLHFFVMQLIEGRPLDYVLEHHGPLPVDLVRSIVFQVGSALGYAHRQGVVHRDIKPANLLLDRDGNAVVTDFGIAKMAEAPGYTQTGLTIGTPTYMSPEQYLGGEVGWHSDQYSLGVVVHEMLTGSPPYTGTAMTIMQGHLQGEVPPIAAVRPDCPAELAAAVARMLDKDPARRWPSMAEALRALGAFLPPDGDPVRDEIARLATPDPALLAVPHGDARPSPLPAWRTAPPGLQTLAATINLATVSDTIEVGETIRLSVDIRDAAGAPVQVPIRWSVDNPAVAEVDAGGELIGRAPGLVAITASAEGLNSSARMRVAPAAVARVEMDPPSGPLRAGQQVRLSVQAYDRRGQRLDRPARWQCDRVGTASVGEDGLLVAHGAGVVAVTVTVDQVAATAHLTVIAADAPVLPEEPGLGASVLFRVPQQGGHRPAIGSIAEPVEAERTATPRQAVASAGTVRRKGRRRGTLAGAGAMLLLVVVVGIVVARTRGAERVPEPVVAVPPAAPGGAALVDASAEPADRDGVDVPSPLPAGGPASGAAGTEGVPPAGQGGGQAIGSPAPAPARTAGAALEADARPLIEAFARALATGDQAGVRRVYPGLRGEEPWWQFASARSGSDLRLSYFEMQAGSPTLTGEAAAEAIFEATYTYQDGGEAARQWFLFRALLRFDGARWRISEIRYY